MSQFEQKIEQEVSRYFYPVSTAISLILMLIMLSPLSSLITGALDQKKIVEINQTYLSDLETTDKQNLILLGEINGALAIINSGELGISFIVDANIKIGHALSALTDISQKAMEATLASLTVATTLQWLLKLSEWAAPYFFTIFIAFCVLFFGAHIGRKEPSRVTNLLRPLLTLSFLLFVSAHLLIPYSIYGAAKINHALYLEMEQENASDLKNLHGDVVKTNKHKSLKERAEDDIKKLENIFTRLTEKTEMLISYHTKKILYSVIKTLVIPLLLFLTLFWISKLMLTRVLEESKVSRKYIPAHRP